jgi:Domain of unknown function (DUF4159)/Aerotolerance regulator N-terminal
MQSLSQLSFLTPFALWGLLALPIIWWLLRFTPPRPQIIQFPPLRILLGLKNKLSTPDKTPWWLLLLRLALAAFLIIAVSHPMLRQNTLTKNSSGPLLLIVDDGWAAAKTWEQRKLAALNIIEDARSNNRVIVIAGTTATIKPNTFAALAGSDAENLMRAMKPNALNTDRAALIGLIKKQKFEFGHVVWLTDGLDAGSAKNFKSALTKLSSEVSVQTLDLNSALTILTKPIIENSEIIVSALRNTDTNPTAIVQARAGNGRILTETKIEFKNGNVAQATLSLPVELRNEIQTLSLKDEAHAGAVQLLDDRWRRKTVAIQSSAAQENAQPLLSPTHYVKSALLPFADLLEPNNTTELKAVLSSGLSMLLLADVGKLPDDAHDAIANWIEKGGVLLRFAGPHMAAASDDLIPVQLRVGDRNLGSALSWETPQAIKPFDQKSPFAGLRIEPDISVSRQLLAEPDLTLTEKTWASLSDGTPLVTAVRKGKGLVVLFHITANADWSNLPLSGTFVQMLQRITDIAPAAGSTNSVTQNNLTNEKFATRLMLTGSGELVTPEAEITPLLESEIDQATATSNSPAGLYMRGGQERAINLNLDANDLAPIKDVPLEIVTSPKSSNFAPILFALAALLFLADSCAAIFLGGGLRKLVVILTIFMAGNIIADKASADDQSAMKAALETHLAYVKTDDAETDLTSQQGMIGLSLVVADRTSAVLGDPVALDLDSDDLVFYPLIYWPVTENDKAPSDETRAKLQSYMKNGGTLFFDLRDNSSEFGGSSASEDALKRILEKLDISPLETVPESHALTRSFYLLKKFPGRYETGSLWVEAQNADGSTNTSDGVSGIIIGSNDYAAAWAMDAKGHPTNALIPGSDRQREMAFRVGVNVVMYVLTGNYKTDQVHIPALLKRLGE